MVVCVRSFFECRKSVPESVLMRCAEAGCVCLPWMTLAIPCVRVLCWSDRSLQMFDFICLCFEEWQSKLCWLQWSVIHFPTNKAYFDAGELYNVNRSLLLALVQQFRRECHSKWEMLQKYWFWPWCTPFVYRSGVQDRCNVKIYQVKRFHVLLYWFELVLNPNSKIRGERCIDFEAMANVSCIGHWWWIRQRRIRTTPGTKKK